jgi:hypothetical protein
MRRKFRPLPLPRMRGRGKGESQCECAGKEVLLFGIPGFK